MEFRSRPNSWVSQDTASTTQLTYALQVNPAPITVSIPKEDPVLASLEFVITNATSAALSVQSVTFTMLVGAGASLTPTTDGITTAVSDTTNWNVVGPSSIITSGTATYTLEPATGSGVSLAVGASVVVQLFQIQTNTTPGNTIVTLKEMVDSKPGFTNFEVTTFPTGFYFNGLSANVQSGSDYVPVAQVSTGSSVTLLWNSSVVDVAAFTIYYSNASQGQQTATPTDIGEWTSGALTSDTVFTLVVKVGVEGGQPLPASMSLAVSVQNPSLVAASVQAGQATVTGVASIGGALTANAVTATGLTVNGVISASSASISGSLNASGANISGNVGIGTTSPGSLLDVNGTAQLRGSAGGTGLTVDANGNVGIGSTSLGNTLLINGDTGLQVRRASNQDQTLTLTGGDGGGTAGITAYYQLNLNAHGGGSGSPFVGNANITFEIVDVEQMAINAQGVGIGTANPQAPLHVAAIATAAQWPSMQDQYLILNTYVWNSSSSNTWTLLALSDRGQTSFPNTSILAAGAVAAPTFFSFSDERIKNIRGRSDSAADLHTLLGIEVTDFSYKDVVGNGNATHKKVIAQQVEKVFPQAVGKQTNVVPDINRQGSFVDGWVSLATDVKKGERVRLISDKVDGIYEVLEATQDKFRTDFKPEGDKVFVFGREVDDFRTIDYDAIAMLNVSATQQLKKEKDEEMIALRAESAELKAANDALIKRLQILESKMEAALNSAAKAAHATGLKQ